MTPMTKEALADRANIIASIMEYIASFEPEDIDCDRLDLRFEDECGVDTGCDVSIIEHCQVAADLIRALLDELEAKDKRIAEQAGEIDSLATVAAHSAAHVKRLQSRAESAEQALPDGLIKAVEFYEQVKRENTAVETGAWKDAVDWVLKEAVRAAGITPQIQGGE